MRDYDYQQIDDIIHSRIRLAAMSVLTAIDEADFTFLRNKIGATDGNLSVHLKKLEEAGYIDLRKNILRRKPNRQQKTNRKSPHGLRSLFRQPGKNDKREIIFLCLTK